ncbi:MAG: acyl-CoA thioesterase [Anaerolineae bacterium]|nr:acyl-CoA thioesterase [Anaerolineae bacterium]
MLFIMNAKPVQNSRITLSVLMGVGDANTMGNVHGGLIMKLCDEAAGMAATKHARRPSVTVAVDSMFFHSPVHIGSLVTVQAEVSWVGRSSMETKVVVSAENVITGEIIHTNTAYFVYVALDENGRPTPVPPLLCETDNERENFSRAAARQAYRLEQRKQGNL